MRKLAAVLLAFVATVSFADQPSRESQTQPLYVLRAYVFPNAPSAYQGIFRFDLATKTYTPLASFFYNSRYIFPGSVRLGATADRIIVQSALDYEFDLVTGRLLRSYRGNDATDDGWVFHGVVVTDEQARSLGIASGTYGFPLCPGLGSGIFVDPGPPITCRPHQFSGYSAPTYRPFSVLLRRSLDPADPTLTAVKAIGPELAGTNETAVAPPQSAIALDSSHSQFWTWAGGHWATLPISGGIIGNPNPAQVSAPNAIQDVTALTFHEPTQTLFDIFELAYPNRQFVQQSTTVNVIEQEFLDSLSQPRNDAVTAVPVALPERYVQVIPAIGELNGANGTFWRSDVWLYNPADVAIDVSIRRVARPDKTSVQHLPAHGSVLLRNALSVLGGGAAGDGVTLDALVIDAPYQWGAQLSAYSRTFTDGPDGGTYGQSVPAVPSAVGYSTHPHWRSPNYIFNSTLDASSSFVIDHRVPGRYRHNIGVVNDNAAPLEVHLSYGPTATVFVAAHSVGIFNVESLFAASAPQVFVEAERPAPVWMSVVDNLSADATFIPFETFPYPTDSTTEMAIPAIAAIEGANGTSWRTDLFGILPTQTLGQTTLATTQFDTAAGCTAAANLQPDSARALIYDDIAHQFGGCSGSLSGALRVAGSIWMAGYSRTYTTRADGGTFGDMLPFYPAGGWPLQHFGGIEVGAKFRINVGLYNGQSTTTTNRLLLYDASGALVAQRDINLASHASLQAPIASLLNVGNLPEGLYGLSVIPTGSGRSWAYVSLVDNVTGDPTNLW